MLENSYKIEQVLVEILYTVTNDVMCSRIIELLTVLNEFGYTDTDVLILNELMGKEVETGDMGLFIKNKLLKISMVVLKELGIVLEDDIRLQTVLNIMLTLYTINNIDSSLKEPLLTILDDNEKDNVEKVAVIVSLHSNGEMVETYESIEDVSDIFISSYVSRLRADYELSEDSDTDVFDDEFKVMTKIIEIDPIMTNTLVVRSMMSGVDISRNMSDHIELIAQSLDQTEYHPQAFAANIATLLHTCDDTKDDVLGNYTVYFEDNLLSDLDMDVVGNITNLVKEYAYKLKDITYEEDRVS